MKALSMVDGQRRELGRRAANSTGSSRPPLPTWCLGLVRRENGSNHRLGTWNRLSICCVERQRCRTFPACPIASHLAVGDVAAGQAAVSHRVKNPLAIGRPRPPENTAPYGAPPVPHPDRRALLILFAAQQDSTPEVADELHRAASRHPDGTQ